MPSTPAELEAAVAKMRALGVTKWNGIELGPEPTAVGTDSDTDQPSGPSADERAKQTRAERQRVASLASGGPVKTVGGSAR